MNILKLQEQIFTFLKTKSSRVFFQEAPANTVYPYVVYDLPNSNENFEREDFVLEVDLWDDTTNTTAIETLVGNIDGDGHISAPTGLHRKNIYVDGVISAKIYRESRLTIVDEDPRIKRRQLRYQIQAYL